MKINKKILSTWQAHPNPESSTRWRMSWREVSPWSLPTQKISGKTGFQARSSSRRAETTSTSYSKPNKQPQSSSSKWSKRLKSSASKTAANTSSRSKTTTRWSTSSWRRIWGITKFRERIRTSRMMALSTLRTRVGTLRIIRARTREAIGIKTRARWKISKRITIPTIMSILMKMTIPIMIKDEAGPRGPRIRKLSLNKSLKTTK